VVFPDFQPMKVSEIPVCIYLLRQNPVFTSLRRYDMNGRFKMQGGKNWILLKEKNANRFFSDSHRLEIWSNPGPNGGSVAMDSEFEISHSCCTTSDFQQMGVPEKQFFIHLFQQNPVFTSLGPYTERIDL
jgi:hypothetical protein